MMPLKTTLLNNISQHLTHGGTTLPWQALIRDMEALIGWATVRIALLDSHNQQLNAPGDLLIPLPYEPFARHALAMDEIVHITDATAQGASEKAPRTWLGCALRTSDGQNLGVMAFEGSMLGAASEDDVLWLRIIARQLAFALENTALRARVHRQDALYRILNLLTSSLDLQEILPRVAQGLTEMFGVDHVGVAQWDTSDDIRMVAEYPSLGLVGTVVAQRESPQFQAILAQMEKQGVVVVTPEMVGTFIGTTGSSRTVFNATGTRNSLIVPLLVQDQLVGSISLDSSDPDHLFSESDYETFRTVAAQVALAMRNADLYSQAVTASRLKSEFLANVSHELRTPLNAIIGYTELLLGQTYGVLNDSQIDRLSRVYNSGTNLLELINDILDLSKVEAGRMDLELSPVEINALIVEVVSNFALVADKKNLTLLIRNNGALPKFVADARRLRQVLSNLLGNAIKFTREGSVTVSAESVLVEHGGLKGVDLPSYVRPEAGRWLLWRVSDTGIGIRPQDQHTIFEAFRQGDGSSVREYEGTGLGLAICERFVTLHRGFIWVESDVGHGSTFYILLPTPPIGISTQELEQAHDGRPLVLVLDDDLPMLQLVEDYLTRGGYRVKAIAEPLHLFDYVMRLKPSAIITDVMMPHIDGWEVLRRLKGDPQTEQIPVIVLSILDKKTTGYYLGAAEYLVKPVSQQVLLETLARFVNIPLDAPILVVDDKNNHRMLVQEVLQMQGYTVIGLNSGEDALQWLTTSVPALMILDIVMPGMSGFDVLRQMRTMESAMNIPVIIATARDLTTGEKRKLEQYHAQVLGKHQMSGNALVEQVRIALNRRLQRDSMGQS